jgi:hypothetical protein
MQAFFAAVQHVFWGPRRAHKKTAVPEDTAEV